MYTPIEVVLGSEAARRLARSALPDAPVAAHSVARSPLGMRFRWRAATALRRAAEVIERGSAQRPADAGSGEPARG